MTSTTTFGGFAPDKRNSSKVLKPPGGGSSDIFGAGSQDASTPRRVKNHQHSNLFLSDEPTPTNTPARNHDGQMNGGGENGHSDEGPQQHQAGAMMNGNGGAVNGNPAPQAPTQPRARVPPGGFSSGLW